MTETKRKGERKRSPRTKGKWKASKASETLKALWKTPEFRERMRIRNENQKKSRRLPNRLGTPDGMRRAEAQAAWAEAEDKAKRIIRVLEKEGQVPVITVPDSDEGKAKAALEETFKIALGPSAQREKIQALRTVLEYTKQKPVQKVENKISSAKEWLDAVLEEDAGNGTDETPEAA